MLFLFYIFVVSWVLSLGFDVMLRVTSAQHVKAPTHRNPASPEPGGGARDVLLYSLVRTGTHQLRFRFAGGTPDEPLGFFI